MDLPLQGMTDSWQDSVQRGHRWKPAKKKHNLIIISGFLWRSKSKGDRGLVGNGPPLVQGKKRLTTISAGNDWWGNT